MSVEADQLLQAEEAVNRLLDELIGLKNEIAGYETARTSLESVRFTLEKFVAQTAELTDRTHGLVAEMGKIGTPEILARVEGVKQLIDEMSNSVGNDLHQSLKTIYELKSDFAKNKSEMENGFSISRKFSQISIALSAASIAAIIVILIKLFV